MIDVVLHLDGDHTCDISLQIPVISSDDMPLAKVSGTDRGQMDAGDTHGDHNHGHHQHGDAGDDGESCQSFQP